MTYDKPGLLSSLSRLRHYAQSLCCSRSAGDDLLMATINRLDLSKPATFENLPFTLFRLLHETYDTLDPQAEDTCTSRGLQTPSLSVDRLQISTPCFNQRLESVNLHCRKAFLLVAQAGFARSAAAAILEIDDSKFDSHYACAENIILSRKSTDVLIIEDDAFVSADLGRIMEGLGHSIAGFASTRQQAVNLAATQHPGLILCDICLADGSSGINAVNDILGSNSIPVVFITAHPDRLFTDPSRNTAHIVRKPYSAGEIRIASSQVLFHRQSQIARYQDCAAA